MIDVVYKTLLTIINKENQGYVTPEEFNIIANNVQNEIFRNYFESINKDKIKEVRGYSTQGYGNLNFNERQRLDNFARTVVLSKDDQSEYVLPEDVYFIEDKGITSVIQGQVIEEVEKTTIGFVLNSSAKPTIQNAIYEKYSDKIKIHPSTVQDISIRYIKTPNAPKWTYFSTSTSQLFDSSNPSYQDFELHESEFSNIVNRMLVYFGINLRESEIVEIAQLLKDKVSTKEEN